MNTKTRTWKHSATKEALKQMKAVPGGYVRAEDLPHVSRAAAAQALSRLATKGLVERVAKGLYYVPRETLLGPSKPSDLSVLQRTTAGHARPMGVSAANALGVSTQVPAKAQVAFYGSAKPKYAEAARVKLRKSSRVDVGTGFEAALLEVLRDGGRYSELSAEDTSSRLRSELARYASVTSEKNRKLQRGAGAVVNRLAFSDHSKKQAFVKQDGSPLGLDAQFLKKMVEAGLAEPPRVRAALGAFLEWSGSPSKLLAPLRESLNPLSKFDFGLFKVLPTARDWQAK